MLNVSSEDQGEGAKRPRIDHTEEIDRLYSEIGAEQAKLAVLQRQRENLIRCGKPYEW